VHNAATHLLSAVMIGIGIVMLASTLIRGGGPFTFGVVLGVLFIVAGVGRLYVQRKLR
jgi:hypothetical protein